MHERGVDWGGWQGERERGGGREGGGEREMKQTGRDKQAWDSCQVNVASL